MDIDTPTKPSILLSDLPLPEDAMDLDHPPPPPAPAPNPATSPHSRPAPPPVVLITASDLPAWPKFKLDQLFVEWLSRPDSTRWLAHLLEQRAPRTPEKEKLREKSAPGSPVSRLFSNHIPFGDDRTWEKVDDTKGMAKLDLRATAPSTDPVEKEAAKNISVHEPSPMRTDAPNNLSPTPPPPTVEPPQPMQTTTPPSTQRITTSALPPAPPSPTSEDSALMTDTRTKSPTTQNKRSLPPFYFPCGRDRVQREEKEACIITNFFKLQREQKHLPGVSRADMAELVVDVIGLPSYFAGIVFSAVVELYANVENNNGVVEVRRSGSAAPVRNLNGNGNATSHDATMGDVNSPHKQQPNGFLASNNTATTSPATTVATKTSNNNNNNNPSNSSTTTTTTTISNSSSTVTTTATATNNAIATTGSNPTAMATQPNLRDPTTVVDPSVAAQAAANVPKEFITEQQFRQYYNNKCRGCSKEQRLFNFILGNTAKRSYLIPNDFKPLLRALLLCHQGLAFLHATPEFQQRYSETVIERIYFGCTKQHNGRLTLNDIKRSNLLQTLLVVDEEEDINRERKYFSYEHFYVLYCRFWELDANHDLQIDREDLMRYGSHSLTYRIVDRIFGGYARPLDTPDNPGFMSYTDFIWFCLSEEDKTSDTAIDYWFRCVDMDGDGLITMYDMEFFYSEQLHRMECFGHEPVQIRDILCQLLDMINPNVKPPVIRRKDLKRCRLAGNFFNVLFNLNKFFAIEARDPLQIRQEHATPELTDWDRFAALEYLRLSAEEEGDEDESWDEVADPANPLMAGEAPF